MADVIKQVKKMMRSNGNAVTEYTENQRQFLVSLAQNKDIDKALEEAGYNSRSKNYVVTRLREEIKEIANSFLLENVLKASRRLGELVDTKEGSVDMLKVNLEASKEILDRQGFTKVHKAEIQHEVVHGVVMLPPKKEAETIDVDYEEVTN